MRGFTQTHYCADASCPGFEGFEVRWAGATDVDPAWPITDTCPHCRAGMLDEPVQFEDAIDGLLDELLEGGGIGPYDLATIDRRQLLAAVQAELARQARARWEERNSPCARCQGRGEVLIGSHSVGGGCWNDQWDVCPSCNGESAVNPDPFATPKEKVA